MLWPFSRPQASGINEVIVKPFNKANIEEMVATWGGLRVEPLPQLNLGTYTNLISPHMTHLQGQ